MSERKYDEDLGKAVKFTHDLESLRKSIMSFGQGVLFSEDRPVCHILSLSLLNWNYYEIRLVFWVVPKVVPSICACRVSSGCSSLSICSIWFVKCWLTASTLFQCTTPRQATPVARSAVQPRPLRSDQPSQGCRSFLMALPSRSGR